MGVIDAYFADRDETVYTADQTPDDGLDTMLADGGAFVRVGRVGGAPSGDEHTDRPVIDIDVLAGTRAVGKAVSNLVQQLLMSKPHPIDHCNVLMSPQRVPWVEGSTVRRFYASYQLGLRR